MRVFQGRSHAHVAAEAVREATQDWDASAHPQIVFVFASTRQDPGEVASLVAARFADALVVGCTSTGENLGGVHSNGALVIAGLETPHIRWASALIDNLAQLTPQKVQAASTRVFEQLQVDVDDIEPDKYFALTFVDGLSMREEILCSYLTDTLEGVAFLGGSAGDDLAFARTFVFHDGRALSDAAILVLGAADTSDAFRIVKHQHFATSGRRLAITRCDPSARRVYEIDGYPALDAYARALGKAPEEVDEGVSFMHPLTLSINNEIYVRSIQKIEADGSLIFYCAIEEGMVLEIGGHHDMVERLREDLGRLTTEGPAAFMLTFNCILRALEAKNDDHADDLDATLRDISKTSIGFDTYGEQLNGLHINQTLVALALTG